MKYFEFTKSPVKVTASDAFREASAEELRVFTALSENGFSMSDEDLAKAAGVSKARCASAVALWQEAGILLPKDRADAENTVSDLYEERKGASPLSESSGTEIARSIRENRLATLFDECAALMNKHALTNEEVKAVANLADQYALGEEYIAALAAHLAANGRLTVKNLVRRAVEISEKGIQDAKALVAYLQNLEKQNGEIWEVRKICGIYSRSLSPTEEKLFKKWTAEYLFSAEIIGEAYDITVLNTGKASLLYMDTLLTAWHDAKCFTVEQVRALREKERAEQNAEKDKKPRRPKAKTPKPRYGDFDPNEALELALQRSYGSEKK